MAKNIVNDFEKYSDYESVEKFKSKVKSGKKKVKTQSKHKQVDID